MKNLPLLQKNRKLVLWIAAAILFLGFYWLLFLATMNGAGEVIVEDGQNTFEAQFSHVAAVIPANNDVALQELLDENPSIFRDSHWKEFRDSRCNLGAAVHPHP